MAFSVTCQRRAGGQLADEATAGSESRKIPLRLESTGVPGPDVRAARHTFEVILAPTSAPSKKK
jgi:hypothetical protein